MASEYSNILSSKKKAKYLPLKWIQAFWHKSVQYAKEWAMK